MDKQLLNNLESFKAALDKRDNLLSQRKLLPDSEPLSEPLNEYYKQRLSELKKALKNEDYESVYAYKAGPYKGPKKPSEPDKPIDNSHIIRELKEELDKNEATLNESLPQMVHFSSPPSLVWLGSIVSALVGAGLTIGGIGNIKNGEGPFALAIGLLLFLLGLSLFLGWGFVPKMREAIRCRKDLEERKKQSAGKISELSSQIAELTKQDDARRERYMLAMREYEKKLYAYEEAYRKYTLRETEAKANYYKTNKSELKSKLEKETEELKKKIGIYKSQAQLMSSRNAALEKEAQKVIENELKNFYFPEKYYYAIDEIITLIEDGRADTLKEAINLYEELKEREYEKLASQPQQYVVTYLDRNGDKAFCYVRAKDAADACAQVERSLYAEKAY